jgi:hypothetical protein
MIAITVELFKAAKGIVLFDWEKIFLATVNGKVQDCLKYTKEEFINCKHVYDFPGFLYLIEWAHLNPQSEEDRGRGAQLLSTKAQFLYDKNLQQLNAIQLGLPKYLTPRVIDEMGFGNDKTKSNVAWFLKIQKHMQNDDLGKIISWFKDWHPETEKEKRQHQLRENSRRDATERIDRLASKKCGYKHPNYEDMYNILLKAFNTNTLSKEAKEDRGIKFKTTKGKKDKEFVFNKSSCMALYCMACTEDGEWRTDTKGNLLGINTILFDLDQHHAHHAGKGSGASCRAKLRHDQLRAEENKDRKKNGIKIVKKELKETDDPNKFEEGGFNDPRPEVRKRHEDVNKELLRLIRDSKISPNMVEQFKKQRADNAERFKRQRNLIQFISPHQ